MIIFHVHSRGTILILLLNAILSLELSEMKTPSPVDGQTRSQKWRTKQWKGGTGHGKGQGHRKTG